MKKLTLIIIILGMITISNAQINENELKMSPKMEEMVVAKLKNEPVEKLYRYGIKDKEQLENLQLGRAIREYVINIENDTLIPQGWRVPIMYEGKALFLAYVTARDAAFGAPRAGEEIHHYEHKELIGIVMVNVLPWEYHYIRRDHKDVFIQVFDPETRQYFKNEYSLSEIISLNNRALELRAANTKESRQEIYEIYGTNQVDENDIFDTHFPQKHELKITPEITKMLTTDIYWSFINDSDWNLSNFGITNRVQLENLQLGKPISEYRIDIDNKNLIFTGIWRVFVMSGGGPLFLAKVIESVSERDGQYSYIGGGGAKLARNIHNYEHKELIIGCIQGSFSGLDYLIIRREHKDVFVQVYDPITRENFKNEYTLSEILNLLKK